MEKKILNKMVSVLIDGERGPEAWIGQVVEVTSDYIVLDFSQTSLQTFSRALIMKRAIRSVLIYKE